MKKYRHKIKVQLL